MLGLLVMVVKQNLLLVLGTSAQSAQITIFAKNVKTTSTTLMLSLKLEILLKLRL